MNQSGKSTQSGKKARSVKADRLYREIELRLLEKSKEELERVEISSNLPLHLMDNLFALKSLNEAYNNGK